MNSRKILFTVLYASLMLMLSCKKNSSPTTGSSTSTQTVEATIAKSATYSYSLPATTSAYAITTQSSHASLSNIVTDANGNLAYNYTAGAEYVGIDTVVVSEIDSNCMHGDSTHMPPPPPPPFDSTHMPPPDTTGGHGHCHHPMGPKPGGRQIIFHINVKDGTVTP